MPVCHTRACMQCYTDTEVLVCRVSHTCLCVVCHTRACVSCVTHVLVCRVSHKCLCVVCHIRACVQCYTDTEVLVRGVWCEMCTHCERVLVRCGDFIETRVNEIQNATLSCHVSCYVAALLCYII